MTGLPKSAVLNVRVESSLLLRLRQEQDRTGCGVSEFVRRAVVRELNRLADERRQQEQPK